MSRRVTQHSVSGPSGTAGLLSVEEVAASIGRHPEVIRRQARAGRLPAEKIGRVWFFRPEALVKAGYPQFGSSVVQNQVATDPLLLALSKAGLEALQLRDRDRIFEVVGERLAEVGVASYFFLTRDDFAGLVVAHEHVGSTGAATVRRLTGNPRGPSYLSFDRIPVLHRACLTRQAQYIGDPQALVDGIRRTLPDGLSANAQQIVDTLDLRTAVSAPFVTQDRVIGAITVIGPGLKSTDLPAIMAFANQTAAAIETARLLAQSRQTQEAFVQTLAGAIELRDQLHSRTAERAELADRVADHLGLDPARRRRVRYAALLQDLGKLGLPDTILNKQSRLDAEERAIMMTHPITGAELLGRFEALADLAPLVRAHHEWFNGEGYPDGLRGEEIPIEMRIVAVVNAFFNVTLDTPGGTPATLGDGIGRLKDFAGVGLDPTVTEGFIRMCRAAAAARAPWYERLDQAMRDRYTVEPGSPRDVLTVADSRELRIIYRIAQETSAVLDLDVLLQRIVRIIREVMGYYMVAVMLPAEDMQGLIVGAQSGYAVDIAGKVLQPGEGVTGWVFEHGSPLIVPDVQSEARYIGLDPKVRSELAFPLMSRGRLIGVLNAESDHPNAFSAADIALMSAVGSQLAACVEVAQLHDTLKREATHDPLTRLNNRRLFIDRIQQEIARAGATGEHFSLVFLDVNDLKLVNDSYGHLAGDALLREVANALTDAVRGEDVVARYGGDEFVVLLPGTPRAAAAVVAQRITDGIARHRFMAGRQLLQVPGVSLGLATFPEDGQTADDLIARADITLYEQKRRTA